MDLLLILYKFWFQQPFYELELKRTHDKRLANVSVLSQNVQEKELYKKESFVFVHFLFKFSD